MRSFKRPRTGFTMLEMLTVLTAFSLLMVISASWLHYSISFASVTKKRQRYHQNLKRLATELRGDIRQCQQMSLVNPYELKLVVDKKQTTSYKIDGMNVDLVRTDGEVITSRDRFDLGPQSVVRWDKSEMPEWISLLVERCPPGSKKSPDEESADDVSRDSQSGGAEPAFELIPPIDLHVRGRPNAWK